MRLLRFVRLPRGTVLANLAMAGLGVVFAVSLARTFSDARTLPPPPVARQVQAGTPATEPEPARLAEDRLETYNTIVVKSLFSPARNESGSAAAGSTAAALPPKPVLHGLIVDGPGSLAYLEDPGTKRVVAYHLGDAVAGGRLTKVTEDRILITRADGVLDVLLKDPSKPEPVAVAEATGAGRVAANPPGNRRQAATLASRIPPLPAVERPDLTAASNSIRLDQLPGPHN